MALNKLKEKFQGYYAEKAFLQRWKLINPFVPNAPFLYPLKTSENRLPLKTSENRKVLRKLF